MISIDAYLNDLLARGQAYFAREQAGEALGLSPHALSVALLRQVKKGRLANPRRGFYLILRPEDRTLGAPEPARWIDPLMKSLRLDYRIALLRAAAFHGASHQAPMVFQVIVPKQLSRIEAGRQRVEFLYQQPKVFSEVNRPEWLDSIKRETGYSQVSGVELTLLDCARYFHSVGGINGLAQIVQDLGEKASPEVLTTIAGHCENASVRRLGYLLDLTGHSSRADGLRPLARKAKSFALLDPAVKSLPFMAAPSPERSAQWQIIINQPVEVDF